jgi:hypothetical protein
VLPTTLLLLCPHPLRHCRFDHIFLLGSQLHQSVTQKLTPLKKKIHHHFWGTRFCLYVFWLFPISGLFAYIPAVSHQWFVCMYSGYFPSAVCLHVFQPFAINKLFECMLPVLPSF